MIIHDPSPYHSPAIIPRSTGVHVSIITPETKYIVYTTVFSFIQSTNINVNFGNFIISAKVDAGSVFLKQSCRKQI